MKRFKKLLQNHQSRYKEKSEKNKKKQKNKTKTKQKNNKKKNMVQNRFSQKTNKNMLPSLTQIFTQRSCPVYLPHPGSSHIEECTPNKQVLSKSLKMYSQNP